MCDSLQPAVQTVLKWRSLATLLSLPSASPQRRSTEEMFKKLNKIQSFEDLRTILIHPWVRLQLQHSKAWKVTLKFLFATKLRYIWISVCSHPKPHWEWLCWQQWVKEYWVLLFTLRFYTHVVIQSIISIIAPPAAQAGKYGRTNLNNRLNVIRMNTHSLLCYTTINLVVLTTHFLFYLVSPLVPEDLTCLFSHSLDFPLPPCGLVWL